MKYFYIMLFALLILSISNNANAQERPGNMNRPMNSIKGKVLDTNSKVPMEYANAALFSVNEDKLLTGSITGNDGTFEISPVRPGEYYLKVSFIGFQEKTVDSISIGRGTNLDLGEIFLEPENYSTDEVIVSGEKAPITYQIDKKVINVNQQITTLSGTAVDVLENVPSITVDIDGNVSLRGSTNFTLLIDGRPSLIGGSEALQQIPAGSIENIEIITNPSAKYNPEGTAGIINVILKKNEMNGISGVLTLNGGLNNKYGSEGLFSYKVSDVEFILGVDYNKRMMESESKSESWTIFEGNQFFNNSSGSGTRGRESYGLRGSIGFSLWENSALTFNGRYSNRKMKMGSGLLYTEWNNLSSAQQNYKTDSQRERGGDNFSLGFNFNQKFSKDGHELYGEAYLEKGTTEESSFYNRMNSLSEIVSGQKDSGSDPENEFRIKADYVLPLSEESKFEAGFQSELENSEENTEYFEYDPDILDYMYNDLYSKSAEYKMNTHSIYSMYSGKILSIGFQAGLRAEYTDQKITPAKENQSYIIDRWDYFPTLHFSYKIDEVNQMMMSYTRRIHRPHGWQLEPFITWMDAYNVRKGNPSLLPEFIDSYEMSYQLLFGKSIISTDIYYRINNNKIEQIQSVYDDNINLSSPVNIGKDFAFGTELLINFDPLIFWNVNLMGNLYKYWIEGQYDDESFDKNSFNWNTRLNNSFKISDATVLQINGMYNSPSVSAQGERKGFFSLDFAVKQDLFEKQLSLTLQARNLFGTMKWESTSQSDNFYRYSQGLPESPMLMLNARFNFNNYKNGEKKDRNGDDMNGGDVEF
ncbi:MAG: TonB-dependent receptor [bacterium]